MNDDRISEVYKGEIWADEAQERARRRINWMIRQASGDRVLDIGCSQGIASILLGREGFEVVGVDIQESRIEYANADLALESDPARERVRFMVGEGTSLDFEDASFDTVLLGEVIEHLAAPGRVLAEAHRVLRPGGRVVITTPFGVLHHHDHKQTFYPDDVFSLVSEHFGVASAEVGDRYFRIVGEKGREIDPAVLDALRSSSFKAVQGIQEELAEARIAVSRLFTEVEKATKGGAEQARKADLLERRLTDAIRSKARVEEAWRESKAKLRDARADLVDANRARSEAENQYKSVSAELQRTSERANLAARTTEELARARRRLAQLESDRAKLRHRVAVRDWKMASLRERRWWKLGAELGAVRQRPWTIVLLPARVLKVVRSKGKRLPRPTPPLVLSEGGGSTPVDPRNPASSGARQGPDAVARAEAIIPRRDLAAIGLLGEDLRPMVELEAQFFDLARSGWREQISALAPSLLIVDSAARGVSELDVDELLDFARTNQILTVLWDRDGDAIAPNLRSGFDVIFGDGKPPTDDYEGRLVEWRGTIQPRIHNPIGGNRRRVDAGYIDLTNLALDQSPFESLEALISATKDYKVLHAVGQVSDSDAAVIAATATPLIVVDEGPELSLEVDSEEERVVLERSLLRSEVLKARLTHPRMRMAMRERSIGRDFDSILGVDEGWPRIDVMVATMRPEKVDTIFENLQRQTYPNLALWLVAHGIDLDRSEMMDRAERAGVDLRAVVNVEESVILGEVFNIGFGETEAEIVAKMDDDDFYGPEYLWDLYTALDFSGAEVAGKWAHYVYLEGVDSTVYRFKAFEHTYTDVVAISTLLMRRGVLDAERFPAMPWGSGSVFLRALGAQGARVFAADRWNYLYIRGQDGGRNTFPISDMKMLANSEVVCRGLNLNEVTL